MSNQAAPLWKEGINFLSAWFCPFAQRTWIALEEKGLEYTLHEVALKDEATGQWFQFGEKPKWWLNLNPLGKVPVLAVKHGSRLDSVYESSICNEYLEDVGAAHDAPSLFSSELIERAHQRIVIDRFSSKLMPKFYSFLVRQDNGQQEECAQQITTEMKWLESQAHDDGPFFSGSQFSMVDAAIAPWFLRQDSLTKFRGFEMPSDVPKLQRWMRAVMDRPSVKATQRHPEGRDYRTELINHYEWYATNRAKSTSAHDFK